MAERYHCVGETRLEDKLTDEKFAAYLKATPLALPVNQEIADWKARMEARQVRLEEIERQRAEIAAMDEDAEKPTLDETCPEEEPEMVDEERRSRVESETVTLRAQWREDCISKHVVFARGTEFVYFEFKEIVLALAVRLRE